MEKTGPNHCIINAKPLLLEATALEEKDIPTPTPLSKDLNTYTERGILKHAVALTAVNVL